MNREPPTIDMLPDGTFRAPPRPRTVPFSAKLMVGSVLVAAVAASIVVAALAIWVVSMVLPVLIIAGAVGWAALRFRRWQLFRGDGRNLNPRADNTRQPGGFGQ